MKRWAIVILSLVLISIGVNAQQFHENIDPDLFVLTFDTEISSPSAALMQSVVQQYNQRFNSSGQYIVDNQARDRFIAAQNSAIAQIRASGAANRSVKVYNDAFIGSDIVVTVSLVQDPTAGVVGFMIERNKYTSPEDQEGLRFITLNMLMGNGRSLYSTNGVDLVRVSSQNLPPTSGGEVLIKYPTNAHNNTTELAKFEVLKTTVGDFSLFTPDRKGFSRIDLSVWVDIFSQNFGIKSFTFR